MLKNNTNRSYWSDSNPFFDCKNDYDEFVGTMMAAAENGDLPVALEHGHPDTITMNDVKRFSLQFKRDTGLDIEFRAYTCDNCDKLHCLLIVDEHTEDEEEED